METSKCSACQHFVQHYGFFEGAFRRVYCGHCTRHKVRPRKPDAAACKDFCLRVPDGDQPITKKYLTQRLLEHILSLATLPDNADGDTGYVQ